MKLLKGLFAIALISMIAVSCTGEKKEADATKEKVEVVENSDAKKDGKKCTDKKAECKAKKDCTEKDREKCAAKKAECKAKCAAKDGKKCATSKCSADCTDKDCEKCAAKKAECKTKCAAKKVVSDSIK